jgi:hypothetical protein
MNAGPDCRSEALISNEVSPQTDEVYFRRA